ncbi:4'-phosphopantetheinyl transferase superfamily protein [Sphaerisporangium rubeum]|uniref:4'-phosphopantetheinyl transferase EntD n=1 Tax=Sphaerisporangium rubeum TaxID=321317 RepID=A0A7X0IKM8_9ACTN|nr:4'-phosphopantetheinyl transferase EntD [Sphaerisporangium rubeum]
MIDAILPPAVVAAESFDDPPAELFPEEEAAISRAVDKRRKEFATARLCARRAMAALGVPAAPVLPGPRGAPQWPAGVVGSMTHCDGYRAAVLGRAEHVTSVGIDAEPDGPLPPGVLGEIALPEEQEHLRALAASRPGVHWDRMLFSAKESVYKTWFPLTGRWLGFEEAVVALDPAAGSFEARLLVPGPVVDGTKVTGFAGRWLAERGLVVTAIVLPSAGP